MRAHLRIPATDGFPLAATLHGSLPDARAIVVVNGATAVRRGYYGAFADHLAARGLAAVTYDYRGMGESVPAEKPRMLDWGRFDQAGILAWCGKEHADTPLVAVGHSAGGQLVCVAEGAERYQALVGVAAQSGWWGHWPSPLRYRRWLDWHVLMPGAARVLGRVPGSLGLGEDLPKGVALEWARWCRHRDYLLRDDGDARRAGFARIRAPFLSWSFADDAYGPRAAVDALAARFASAEVTRRHVEPRDVELDALGHFGFFRSKAAALWDETAEFLEAAIRPRR